jgi:hypothetical protein
MHMLVTRLARDGRIDGRLVRFHRPPQPVPRAPTPEPKYEPEEEYRPTSPAYSPTDT